MPTQQELFDQSPLGAAFHRASLKNKPAAVPVKNPFNAPAKAPATNPAVKEAAQQLKALGFEVTSEHILAAMELKKAGYPLNLHNLKMMVRRKQYEADRKAPAPVISEQVKSQRDEALRKVLLDPNIMAQAIAEAQRGY